MTPRVRISLAVAYGAAAHLVFAAAVLSMIVALDRGLANGRGPLEGAAAWMANGLLVAQFPLLHSWLLSRGGVLARLAPRELSSDLAPTTFALVAGLQVLATFSLWSPSGIVLAEATGPALWLVRLAFAASWLFLFKAMGDAGLGLQTGAAGWLAVLRGRPLRFGAFPTRGLFRLCRQPIYLGFALTLWTGPVVTPDRLLLALAWSAYCVVGPRRKEQRYLRAAGERFSRYRERVPYFLPRIRP